MVIYDLKYINGVYIYQFLVLKIFYWNHDIIN
jgi:hypothetical protein